MLLLAYIAWLVTCFVLKKRIYGLMSVLPESGWDKWQMNCWVFKNYSKNKTVFSLINFGIPKFKWMEIAGSMSKYTNVFVSYLLWLRKKSIRMKSLYWLNMQKKNELQCLCIFITPLYCFFYFFYRKVLHHRNLYIIG